MAVLSIGQVWGAAISVTTNPTTSGTFTITAAKASGQNAPIEASGCVRLYANNTLTIETSGDANITGMTIAWTKNGSKAFATVTTGTGSYTHPSAAGSGTWTGSAKEIVFNVGSSGQIQITSVDITVEEGGGSSKDDLTDEQLAWSASEAEVTFGDEPYSLPSLTNSLDLSLTYQSTAEAVATISNTGVVSIKKAGSTTIKAVFAGNEDYNAKTVSYTLTVAPAPLTPIAGGIVDEIKISDLLTSGSGYQPFSDKQASNEGHSDAVYAGKVCINSTNIQMNTIGTNTSAGRSIVTTTSGGNAKRVQAFWGGSNTADRKLTVYGSNTAYAGTETAASGTKLGDLTYASGDSYAYIDITGDYAYLQIVASGAIYMSQINITWVAPDVSKVATPEISGTANFYPSTSVSISCSTDDAAIYYTTDGTAPTSASTLYEGAFTVNADGTTTVKAIAVKDGMTDSDVAEQTFTKATVLTVASALSATSGDNVYVTGTITSITEVNVGYKNATYVISDVTAGVKQNEMIVYRGKYIGGADFTSADQIHVGDVVVVSGTIGVYQEKNQLAQGNQIESITPAAVVAPVFSPNGGGFMGETDVTITCATGSSTIYYTLDGTNPTKLSTLYEGAIHLDATTTITAIAYVGEESSLVVAKEFTLTAPMTVAEALAALDSEDPINNVAVAGIISTAPTSNPSSGKLTYYISDDGTDTDELEVFLGFGLNGASFSAKTDLQVGDEVTVFGNLTIYNSTTKEFASGSRLLAFNRPEVAVTGIDLTESIAEVEVGKTVTLHASVVPANATNKTIVWSVQSGDTYASVDQNGVVTGIAAGEAVIRAASDEDATIFAECTVTVTEPAPLSPWATTYTSNVAMAHTGSGVDNGTITIGTDDPYLLVKAGASSSTGTIVVTVPKGTTDLHFHAFAWGGKTAKIELAGIENASVSEFDLAGEAGASGSGNDFTLQSNPVDQYFHVSFDAVAAETEITFSKATGSADNRFFFYGVNQEGGVVPVLKSIAISGDLDKKSYKAGQSLDMTGLEVSATYQLGEETPYNVDITNDAELELTYDPLVENQTSVTITATYKGQTDDITINDLVVTSADPKIYVDPSLTVNFGSVEVGEDVPANKTITITLTNVAAATATLGGTNPEAFNIDQTALVDGDVITISVIASTAAAASYSATITITDNAAAATEKVVNLSFAVTEPVVEDDVTGTWTLVTNETTLAAGKKVIIAQYVEADGAINTMAGQASNNRSVIASTVAGATLTPTVGTKVMTLADAGEGNFYLKTSDGEYLYNASTSSKSYLRTKAEEENVSWTIAVDAEGVATITSVENTNRTKMRYNPNTSGSPLFNCYASGQEDIALYMLEEDTPEPPAVIYTEVRDELTDGRYYTMCLNKAVTAVQGGTIWRVLSKAANGNDVILEEAVLPLVAGRPYIFRASASTLEVAYTGDAVGAPVNDDDNNGLVGSFEKTEITQAATNYIIYNNALYYVNSDKIYVGAYRAYLDMTGVPAYNSNNEPQQGAPRRRVTMTVYNEQTTTGIDELNASDTPVKMIIEGQLFIIRGEKMFDATGRLVK